MAESVVFFLLKQLSDWLIHEKNLLGGLAKEAEYIRNELEHMTAFLRVADAEEDNDLQLKAWVNQVREITYDTEDILQEYILRFTHPQIGGLLGNLRARHQTATDIQTLKLRVENVSKSQQRYRDMYAFMDKGSSSTLPTTEWRYSRGDALLLDEEEVVGFEKPKKQLLEWLLPAHDGVKVISVVGMGGLGKTTLVKKVYDEACMKARFHCHAWVTVSESFKVEHLLKSILKQVEPKNQPSPNVETIMNLDGMKECVYKLLQNTTYIIVLDDIWKVDAWNSIRYAFPRSGAHGYIIITTRFSSIGNAACSETNGRVYNLEPLNAEESEKLFYKKAFPGNSCPFYLKDVSKSILKRCQGLPLSIVVIGGLLATKNNNPEEWQIFERSIGHELQGDNLKGMMKLLSLSYYDLPYYLKACFLYLSIFPEDELLEKWRIIRLWIAEGFVQSKQGKTEEEVAEGYLMELVNRNLSQVAETYTDGRPRKFRIHDILREFIIYKSRECNLFASGNEEIRWPGKIRRLAIHSTSNYTQGSHDNIQFLRSLFFSEFQDSKSGEMLHRVLRGGCRLLKVLDVRGDGVDMGKVMRSRGTPVVDSIPSEVFNLYCLKYLSLRGTNIKIIPKSIQNLQHLETLDLKKSRVSGLPVEILKLCKLHHLLVETLNTEPNTPVFSVTRGFKAPPEIGSHLRNLQKLSLMDADESGGVKAVRELRKLAQLRKLGITKLRREDGMDLCSSIAELRNLRSLSIFSLGDAELMDLDHPLSTFGLPVLRKVLLHGLLRRLPQWLHSLHGLAKLHLEWSRLREDPFQSLGMLPNLVHLKLWFFAYEGDGLIASNCNGGFPKLKELFLGELMGLRWVFVEKGSMPRLEELRVRNCTSLEELPVGIEHLSNLKYVELVCMSGEFIGRLAHQKSIGGEEWKLAHVTKVRVMFFGAGQLQMWNWYKD